MSDNTQKSEKRPMQREDASRAPWGSRKVIVPAGIVAMLLMTFFGYRFYLQAISHESTDDAFVEAQVVTISPRVPGHVARVLVTDNQKVKKGDLLAILDPRDYEVALSVAEARLKSAQAERDEAEAMVSVARNNLTQKDATLKSALASLDQARAGVTEVEAGYSRDEHDLKRMKTIADVGAVSRQEYDHARAQATMSRAQLDSAKKRVDTQSARIAEVRAGVDASSNELRQAQALVAVRTADVQEAAAEVERARLNLSYVRVTAPCDGYVTKKSIEPGDYVQVGQKLLALVGRDVWVVANFKETQIADMRPGQPVEIEVDAFPDRKFKGHVDSIQLGTGSRFTLLPPENATGNFIKVVQRVPVKIVLDGHDNDGNQILAPGMSVVPNVDVGHDGQSGSMGATLEPNRKTAVR